MQFPTFHALLAALLDNDNVRRGAAEAEYTRLKCDADTLLSNLVQATQLAPVGPDGRSTAAVRTMAAVLLRRVLTQEVQSLYQLASQHVQQALKDHLLHAIAHEQERSIRRRMCDVAGELGLGLLGSGGMKMWPELLPRLMKLVEDAEVAHRESALYVLGILSCYAADSAPELVPALRDVYAKRMQDAELTSQREALVAAAFIVHAVNGAEMRDLFVPIVPLMLSVIAKALNAGDEETAVDALTSMVDMVDSHPPLFRPHLPTLLDATLSLMAAQGLEDQVRQLGIELLVSLAEKGPVMCRKMANNGFVQRVVPALLEASVTDDEDDPHWAQQPNELDDYEEQLGTAALNALERVAVAIGAKRVLPVAFPAVHAFMQAESWRRRSAGVLALAYIVPCLPDSQEQRELVLRQVLPMLRDSHPRVRWSALHFIGRLATQFPGAVQVEFSHIIMPALIQALDDPAGQRLTSHAVVAISRMLDDTKQELVVPVLDELVRRLTGLMGTQSPSLLEDVISCVSSLALAAEGQFLPYYKVFMPPLLRNFAALVKPEEVRLRARVLECISLIGTAVGPEHFADAKDVMRMTLSIAASPGQWQDPIRSHVLQSWGRIGSSMREAAAEFLPAVVPVLIHIGQQSVQEVAPSATDLAASHEDDEDEADGVEVYATEEGTVRVRTALVDEKSVACRALASLVSDLGGAFRHYVRPVMALMAPIVTESLFEELRMAALVSLPELLRAANEGASNEEERQETQRLLQFAMVHLTPVLEVEKDTHMLLYTVQTLGRTVEAACARSPVQGGARFVPLLSDQDLHECVKMLRKCLMDALQRRAVRVAQRKVDDVDEEALRTMEGLDEEDNYLGFAVVTALGQLASTHPQQYLRAFHDLLFERAMDMARPANMPVDRRFATFMIDDVIEHGGQAAAPYYEATVPVLLQGVLDGEASIRQAAAFGVGQAAQNGGAAFVPFAGQAVQHIVGAVRQPSARVGEQESATDNAVMALVKIVLHHSQHVDTAPLVGSILSYLPLRMDTTESETVMNDIAASIEARNQTFVGANGEHLPEVLRVVADALPIVGQQVQRRIAVLAHHIRSQLPQSMQAQVSRQLTAEQQRVLQSAESALAAAGS